MISTGVMYFLLAVYAVILLAALWERHYWRALYWFGAIVILVSVIGMTWKAKT
mgnify:CR=1 FL=1